jgi:hypothetical protein
MPNMQYLPCNNYTTFPSWACITDYIFVTWLNLVTALSERGNT